MARSASPSMYFHLDDLFHENTAPRTICLNVIWIYDIIIVIASICFRECIPPPLPLQDTESAARAPAPPLPPRPAGVELSDSPRKSTANKIGAGSDDPASALIPGKDEGGRGDGSVGPSGGGGGSSSGLGSEEEAEVVEELPLPELYVPGRIVHIYR